MDIKIHTLLWLRYRRRNSEIPNTISDHILANALRFSNLHSSRNSNLFMQQKEMLNSIRSDPPNSQKSRRKMLVIGENVTLFGILGKFNSLSQLMVEENLLIFQGYYGTSRLAPPSTPTQRTMNIIACSIEFQWMIWGKNNQ